MTNAAVNLIDRHVEGSLGHKRAFDFNGKPYSYHDVAALANRAGNLLKSLGVGKGAKVLIMLPQSPAYVATLIGAMKIGAVAVIGENAADVSIAVVHEKFLGQASKALQALPKEKVIVVGQAPEGHPSFVEAMRSQPSSLAAEAVSAGDAALVVGEKALSHGEMEGAMSKGDSRLGAAAPVLKALVAAESAVLT